MVKARKYVVRKLFSDPPKKDDYQLVEEELPPLKDGQILVKAEYISVDPYLLASQIYNAANLKLPYDQHSFQVGVIVESKSPKFPVGQRVVSHKGWCDYTILDTAPVEHVKELDFDKIIYLLPDMKGLSPSLAVGAYGMPGVTAYYGFLEICQPKAGETVVVTGAAGAVGSLVGQIAKLKGCRVIGFAGSDKKVQWLEKELGFDKAFNYKTVDVHTALKQAAPKGIDCYFDNVGGEISSTIISQMNAYGRVSVCGAIGSYFDDPSKLPKAANLQQSLVFKQLKIEGFKVRRWTITQWMAAIVQLIDWIKSGQLKAPEHITEGFENLFDAFTGMLAGENFGKAVVKV